MANKLAVSSFHHRRSLRSQYFHHHRSVIIAVISMPGSAFFSRLRYPVPLPSSLGFMFHRRICISCFVIAPFLHHGRLRVWSLPSSSCSVFFLRRSRCLHAVYVRISVVISVSIACGFALASVINL